MSTFLELAQELVTELGIGGANQGATVPTTVLSQTGQLWNAVNWIKQAENNVNLLHTDWQYLALEYAETLSIGSTAVPAHSTAGETVKMWDRQSFWINRAASTAAPLTWVPWEDFRRDILPGLAPTTNSKPTVITQKRDGSLLVDVPCDLAYALTGEFYRAPVKLAADADVPAMPAEYHRLIICEAAIKYGNKEAAAEVINGMEAEYEMLLEKLEGDQLIGGEYDNQHSQDVPIVIGIPGYEDEPDRVNKWWL
jgi:hypothetical protein